MKVSDLIKNKDYDYIEWRVTSSDSEEIFFGKSASKDGKLISLDGDSYDEDTEIIRYEEWSNPKKEIQNGLTVVFVGEWIWGANQMKFKLIETQRNSDDTFSYNVTGDFPVSFREFLKWILDNENDFRVDFQVTNKCYGGWFTNCLELERERNSREWRMTKNEPENFFSEIENKQIVKCGANGDWGQMTYFCTLEESKNEEWLSIRKIFDHLIFIPWYLIKTKFFHKQINLERLYKYGYCTKLQYNILNRKNKGGHINDDDWRIRTANQGSSRRGW